MKGTATIHYLRLAAVPDEPGQVGFVEPDVAKLCKGKRADKVKRGFPTNRACAYRKPLHGPAVLRWTKGADADR